MFHPHRVRTYAPPARRTEPPGCGPPLVRCARGTPGGGVRTGREGVCGMDRKDEDERRDAAGGARAAGQRTGARTAGCCAVCAVSRCATGPPVSGGWAPTAGTSWPFAPLPPLPHTRSNRTPCRACDRRRARPRTGGARGGDHGEGPRGPRSSTLLSAPANLSAPAKGSPVSQPPQPGPPRDEGPWRVDARAPNRSPHAAICGCARCWRAWACPSSPRRPRSSPGGRPPPTTTARPARPCSACWPRCAERWRWARGWICWSCAAGAPRSARGSATSRASRRLVAVPRRSGREP